MKILRDTFRRFRDDERGIVTTDYVFMTAMMMGTSVSVTSGIMNGTVDTGTRLGEQIEFIGRAALNNDLNALSGFTFGGRTVSTDPEPETEPGTDNDTTEPAPEPEPQPAAWEPAESTLNAKQTDRWTDNINGRNDSKLANLVRNQLNKAAKGDRTDFRRSVAGMAIQEMQARGLDTSMQERWYNELL
ncbi:MAG: hypothetical protein AAFR34_00865 [Pseudomonadota bacterium]